MAYCPSTATIFRTSLCVCTCVCVTDRESGRPRYVGWVECACVCVYLFVQVAYTLIPCSDIGRYVFAYTLCVCERVHKVCISLICPSGPFGSSISQIATESGMHAAQIWASSTLESTGVHGDHCPPGRLASPSVMSLPGATTPVFCFMFPLS